MPTFAKLKRHGKLLSDQRVAAEFQSLQTSVTKEAAALHQLAGDEFHKVALRLEKLQLDDAEQKTAQRELQLQERRQFVLSKLDAPDYQQDLDTAKARRFPGSGAWLIQNPVYQNWAKVDKPGHRILYLHGIPGAGSLQCSISSYRRS